MTIAQTVARLIYGGKTFDLNDHSRFYLAEGFTPPATETTLNLTGTIGQSGGRVVGKKARDREWSFEVYATGSSSITQTNQAVSQLQSFLDLAGDKSETLYLEICFSAHIPHRPTFGQAGWSRYEIKHGQARVVDYGDPSGDPTSQVTVRIDALIGPYKLGLPQHVIRASGGIWEDDLLSSQPRGTVVLPATINLFTNPLFMHSTYTTGWTFGASLTYAKNINDEFTLFGNASLFVIRVAAAAFDITQSITAANTNAQVISFYARRQDSGTIDATILKVYYNSAEQTTNFIALADGWYRIWATFSGVTSALASGVRVMAEDVGLYLTGFQFQEASYPTPFIYGDMVGCKWSSTEHNSSSTCADGYISTTSSTHDLLFEENKINNGTIRLAIRWHYASTFGSDQYLFSGPITAYFKASDDKIYFTDGTNTISSAAQQTFAAGDLTILHFVFGKGLMKIYKAGVEIATGSAFDAAAGASFQIGSSATPSLHSCATFLDFVIWKEAAGATQILADYTELYNHISAGDGLGQRSSSIPWVWRIDGIYWSEYQDSTHADFYTIGGIDGNSPARTIFNLLHGTGGHILINLNTSRIPINMGEEFLDCSGTAWAGALGGEVYQASVNTAEVDFPSTLLDILYIPQARYGKVAYIVAYIGDAGTNLTAALLCKIGTSYSVYGDYKAIAPDAILKKFLIGPVVIPEQNQMNLRGNYDIKIEAGIAFKRTAAGAANVSLDYYRVIFGKTAYIKAVATTGDIYYDSDQGVITGTSGYMTSKPVFQGEVIELEPNTHNYFYLTFGELGANTTLAKQGYSTGMIVVPRWSLL